MRKIEISGRMATSASALALAASTLAACGGSSGTAHNGSSAAPAGAGSTATTSSASAHNAGSSTAPSKALSARARSQIAERLHSLRAKAPSSHAPMAPAVQQTAFRSALTHFAGCLREQGVKLPAPNTPGKGPILSTRGVNTNSPQYRAALTKCRSVLVAAFRQAARTRR